MQIKGERGIKRKVLEEINKLRGVEVLGEIFI